MYIYLRKKTPKEVAHVIQVKIVFLSAGAACVTRQRHHSGQPTYSCFLGSSFCKTQEGNPCMTLCLSLTVSQDRDMFLDNLRNLVPAQLYDLM